jgi:N-acetyl-anhydromuramyl-L-alanine amidase AmpD
VRGGALMLGNWNRVRGERHGVMLHYDGSVNDAGGLAWLTKDERCKVSYNWAVDDKGVQHEVAPEHARAWHAGVCRPSDPRLAYTDANSAFYGVTVLADGDDLATDAALKSVVDLCIRLFRKHGWTAQDTWRIVSHESEAFPRGRKVDCTGVRADKVPVLDLTKVRALVTYYLT